MRSVRIAVNDNGDWCAMYVDGKLVHQCRVSNFNAEDLLRLLSEPGGKNGEVNLVRESEWVLTYHAKAEKFPETVDELNSWEEDEEARKEQDVE